MPLSPLVSLRTPDDVVCLLLKKVLDAGAGQTSPAITEAADVVEALIEGVLSRCFVDYNCSSALGSYGAPSSEAGTNSTGSVSVEGFLNDGEYPSEYAADNQGVTVISDMDG